MKPTDKSIEKLYRRRYIKNRSFFMYITDLLLALPLIYIISGLILREFGFSRGAAYIIAIQVTLIAVVLYFLISRIRFDRFIKSERKRICRELCMAEGLLMPEAEFMSLAKKLAENSHCESSCIFAFQNVRPLDAEQILSCYRKAKASKHKPAYKSVFIAALYPPSDDAMTYISYVEDMEIKIADCNDLSALLKTRIDATDDALDEKFAEEYRRVYAKPPFFKRILKQHRISPYLICGTCLYILSFFLKYSLYYRLLGAFCMSVCIFLAFVKNGGISGSKN